MVLTDSKYIITCLFASSQKISYFIFYIYFLKIIFVHYYIIHIKITKFEKY